MQKVSRSTLRASIQDGSRQIGTLRKGHKQSAALVIEDEPGHEVAWVHLGRSRGDEVELVVEIEDGISEQPRKVALAGSVIADYEILSESSGGGGG